MAPYINAHESAIDNDVDINRLKNKIGISHVKLEATAKPPVADDYMYDFKYNHALPTSDVLATKIPADCDPSRAAKTIVTCLSNVLGQSDAEGFANLFLAHGEFWAGDAPPRQRKAAN